MQRETPTSILEMSIMAIVLLVLVHLRLVPGAAQVSWVTVGRQCCIILLLIQIRNVCFLVALFLHVMLFSPF